MWDKFFKSIYDSIKKGNHNKKRKKNSTTIALVALRAWQLPQKDQIIEFFKDKFEERIYVNNWKEDIGTFDLQKYQVIITLMPNKIMWEDFDNIDNLNNSEIELIKGHTSYLMISINGGYENEEINKSMLLSRVVASIIEQANVLGVYWDNSLKIRSCNEFYHKAINSVGEIGRLPYELWFDIKIKINTDFTQNIYTVGMESLGQYDIEITNTILDGYILYILIYELCTNLLKEQLKIEENEILIINNIKLKARYIEKKKNYEKILRLEVV